MNINFNQAFSNLLEASYRVWWKYGQDKGWIEWTDVRDALLELQACKNDLIVSPEYFLDDQRERTLFLFLDD